MSGKDSRTIGKSIEDTRQYHTRYLRAINSPLRRSILRALKEARSTVEVLQLRTGLDVDTLKWHLTLLEYGFCVETHVERGKLVYELTQEGRVVDCLE